MGAVYLDSDITCCKALILSWFAQRLSEIKPGNEQKDPKTRLQEYLQGRKIALPVYDIIDTSGQSHNQQFIVRCVTEVIDKEVIAKGTSRRKAEQAAAQQVLAVLESTKEKYKVAKLQKKQTKESTVNPHNVEVQQSKKAK